jgi:dGTP triphosphohydrolase
MNLTKLRKDIEEGIKQGIVYVEKGVALVREKAEELTDEGKKQYRMYELKTKMQKDIGELGAKVYAQFSSVPPKSLSEEAQKLIDRIRKAEADLQKLEGASAAASEKASAKKKAAAPAKKPAAKKPAAPKPAVKKTAVPKPAAKKAPIKKATAPVS